MNFKKRYEEHERFTTEPGSPIQLEYEYELDELGNKKLVQRGKTNIYEQIQEAAPATEIETILAQTSPEELEEKMKTAQNYMDVTAIPDNMIEAKKVINDLENTWNNLPRELKKKYHNSLDEFVMASGSNQWLIDMGYVKTKAQTETPAEKNAETPAETKGKEEA